MTFGGQISRSKKAKPVQQAADALADAPADGFRRRSSGENLP